MMNRVIRVRGRLMATVPAAALLASLALGAAGTAIAAPGGPTSCMGHEASDISPPGSSEEFPTGMPGLKEFVNGECPGVPTGAVYSTIARLHEGSHALCDAALEGGE